jgi:hypothetical protein
MMNNGRCLIPFIFGGVKKVVTAGGKYSIKMKRSVTPAIQKIRVLHKKQNAA